MSEWELKPFSLERMVQAVEKVRDRLARATQALENAGVPYAVVGGNAVAAWVARVDEAAVRNTQVVDIVIRRSDLDAARRAMEAAGFVYRHTAGIDMFLDGPTAKARDAVHLVFAGEKVRPDYATSLPDVVEYDATGGFRVLALDALVRMKLTSYRRKDQVHLQDMLDVGLIDDTWPERLPPVLAERLKALLADPDG